MLKAVCHDREFGTVLWPFSLAACWRYLLCTWVKYFLHFWCAQRPLLYPAWTQAVKAVETNVRILSY